MTEKARKYRKLSDAENTITCNTHKHTRMRGKHTEADTGREGETEYRNEEAVEV